MEGMFEATPFARELDRDLDWSRSSSGSIGELLLEGDGTYAKAGRSSLWRAIPIPESFPPCGGGGAALVGCCPWTPIGGLGAGRLGTRPLASFGWIVSGVFPGTGGGDLGFSKLVSWFEGNLGLGGGLDTEL